MNPNPDEVSSPRRRLQLKPKAVYICGVGEGGKILKKNTYERHFNNSIYCTNFIRTHSFHSSLD